MRKFENSNPDWCTSDRDDDDDRVGVASNEARAEFCRRKFRLIIQPSQIRGSCFAVNLLPT